MTRWIAAVIAALTTACGVYGAPVRSTPPPAEAQREAPAEALPESETAEDEETDTAEDEETDT